MQGSHTQWVCDDPPFCIKDHVDSVEVLSKTNTGGATIQPTHPPPTHQSTSAHPNNQKPAPAAHLSRGWRWLRRAAGGGGGGGVARVLRQAQQAGLRT